MRKGGVSAIRVILDSIRESDSGERELDISLTDSITIADLIIVVMQVEPLVRDHLHSGFTNDAIDSEFDIQLNDRPAKSSEIVNQEDIVTIRPRAHTGRA